jgi:hypothetical protein
MNYKNKLKEVLEVKTSLIKNGWNNTDHNFLLNTMFDCSIRLSKLNEKKPVNRLSKSFQVWEYKIETLTDIIREVETYNPVVL